MHDQREAKLRRLSIWFAINLMIFISCYLNYYLQLKHRYLYKTLSIGLCLSRAAAMVINFNLVLVWIPMCKYTLTKLAVAATEYNNEQRVKLNRLISKAGSTGQATCHALDQRKHQTISAAIESGCTNTGLSSPKSTWHSLGEKLRIVAKHSIFMIQHFYCATKIVAINSFLIAVDHSTSLHTISATTITMASVIHTVAHLMNVINFSHNYDPLLSDLNMAENRGQNPLQLLVSVPGLTGCFMILILILMSLSSIGAIRNSSFDLFQVFHRLSILFVIFLILHPSSHVLKEQSNVDRHNPEICYDEMVRLRDEILSARANLSAFADFDRTKVPNLSPSVSSSSPVSLGKGVVRRAQSQRSAALERDTTTSPTNRLSGGQELAGSQLRFSFIGDSTDNLNSVNINQSFTLQPTNNTSPCQDIQPKFVAQSSLCWYVLGTGLSCYLMDLILRRLRRNRNSIELLGCRTDDSGNLIELTLSNNHKRFAPWLPGQFVYLNCPQIARYEWHPFTISTMDNEARQFTLHIKTGGDWTRKLRHELEFRNQSGYRIDNITSHYRGGKNSISLFSRKNFYSIEHCYNSYILGQKLGQSNESIMKQQQIIEMVRFSYVDLWSSQDKSQCTTSSSQTSGAAERKARDSNEAFKIDQGSAEVFSFKPSIIDCGRSLFDINKSLNHGPSSRAYKCNRKSSPSAKLDLYVDGPFHSPFERLLKQQVSVCIANGVGWTAFSSVFQQIINAEELDVSCYANLSATPYKSMWLAADKETDLGESDAKGNSAQRLPSLCARRMVPGETKLHLMVIVTNIEQLKPFFNIAMKYFDHIRFLSEERRSQARNYVREVTAYITRANKHDPEVAKFCQESKVTLPNGDERSLLINETFMIIFGRPNFDTYLARFADTYADKRKISIYCCGSYEVKRTVASVCNNLNRGHMDIAQDNPRPIYCYHEENF